MLKFTPLEFETHLSSLITIAFAGLKFTPLEFETFMKFEFGLNGRVKIYSVGV